jgi:hypothetical protein
LCKNLVKILYESILEDTNEGSKRVACATYKTKC